MIFDTSREQNDDFIKFMEVKIVLLPRCVFKVKKPEIFI